MARSSLRLTNYGPAGNVFAGVRYKPSDPSFSSHEFGAPEATRVSTLPNTWESVKRNSTDYAALSSLFYDSAAKEAESAITATGELIAANKQVEIMKEMSDDSGGGRESDEGNPALSAGLNLLGNVAGTVASGGNPVVGKIAGFGLSTIGNLVT